MKKNLQLKKANNNKIIKKIQEKEFFLRKKTIKKISLLQKNFKIKNTRYIFLNKKSYFNFRPQYIKSFFNRFSRKFIKRIILYIQYKIMKKIKKRKEKQKRIIILKFFCKVVYKIKIKLILRRLSFFD